MSGEIAGHVAATRLAIAQAQGPVVLVGHSYGGVVGTEAGTDSKVAGLVYIAAFAPDSDPFSHSSRTRPPARPCRQSCRRRTVISSSTSRSFAPHSRLTSAKRRQRFWPTLKCRGALALLAVRSASLPGGPSRVGIWSRPKTRWSRRSLSARCQRAPARRSRSRWQPRDLYLEAGGGGGAHCPGGDEREFEVAGN